MSGSACKAHNQPGLTAAVSPSVVPARLPLSSASSVPRDRAEPAYRDALFRHLIGCPDSEIAFFVNAARFDLMRRSLGPLLEREGLTILNAASGPFAFEFYAAPPRAQISAFDRDDRLAGLHRELTAAQMIASCEFMVGDMAGFRADRVYDLVLANDLFYAPALDLFDHLSELAKSVAPGGTLYFDVQDERAGPVWKAFGRGGTTRRYNLKAVQAALEAEGFTVTGMRPSLGIKGGLDHILRQILWRGFGIANNFAFTARRAD